MEEEIINKLFENLPEEHILKVLKHDLVSGRNNAHAILLSGSLWSGQFFVAKHIALSLIQSKIPDIKDVSLYPDCHVLYDNGWDISINDIKELIGKLSNSPQHGKHIVIIENIERLNSIKNANVSANALLKTLEEPPSDTIFILTTSSKNDIIPTVLSRLQVVDFKIVSKYINAILPDSLLDDTLEIAIKSKEVDFYKKWNDINAVILELLSNNSTLTEKIMIMNSILNNGDKKEKNKKKVDLKFSDTNLFFYLFEKKTREEILSNKNIKVFNRMYQSLILLQKDIKMHINKKLAIDNFILSNFTK